MHKLLLFCFISSLALAKSISTLVLENFSENSDISKWNEYSDTLRTVGKSKASFVIQQTSNFQRVVLFTLLNPQPGGSAFAGIKKDINIDLSEYNKMNLKVRGQGSFKGYKIIFKDNTHNASFCHFFQAPENFQIVKVLFDDFKPYHEGKLIKDPQMHLDVSKIVSVGIQAYGGAHRPIKQSGAASLEIDWIQFE